MTPLIGITAYGKNAEGRISLPADYVDAVRRAGGMPVLLPPGEPQARGLAERLDGVILAGGGDMDPETYGGKMHPTIYMVDGQRDRIEMDLVKNAAESGRPLFGICRGQQVINVALGGTLIADVPEEMGDKVIHRTPPRDPAYHNVKLAPGSRLKEVLNHGVFSVVSMHHQAVNRLGTALKPVAHSLDGLVEAVELPGHPWLIGVQWHPEMSAEKDPVQQTLFDGFVKAAHTFAEGK